ncbi:tellurite resistance TerB family protein [Mameliella alba]|uniref:tellurite resistance TerB family protein n=1 Tax=Mameliella alba TaxID=561184 RepID=UPI000B52F86D|nr:tellurite resistance TerB family protein [Mameliella alba]MBY6119473.1 tellurite resistance TerB family protein [Mameliella alba]OWV44896.1 protein YebE [Mameliella alba]OWV66545.1 protein YebE [Mameliella alba]
MGLMGTLAKLAIGYAAARGVDRLSGGQGLGSLLGGGAQVPAKTPTATLQAQMGKLMGGQAPQGGGWQEMMEAAQKSGFPGMPGAGGAGANPLADMMKNMQTGGMDLSAFTGQAGSGKSGGLLSQLGEGGSGMAGMLAAFAGSAAQAQGKGAAGLMDAMNAQSTAPEAEAAAALMLRAMIQAAKSDGGIDKAEQAKILETLGEDADPEDRAFIQAQLKAPVDPEALGAEVPETQRMQVYSASLMTIRVDTQAEAEYLDTLAKAMQLDEAVVNMLHMQMGLQPLYG